MDPYKTIFEAAFASLQGLPATTDSFRLIARASIRCAALWVDGLGKLIGTLTDEELVGLIADMAREELADMRKTGDKLDFTFPKEGLH